MKRREFISLLGGVALGPPPFAARAQQKFPTVGFYGPASALVMGAWATAFAHRLRELGWIEGRTVSIETRFGDGRTERLAEVAAEFVRLKVDIIITAGTAVSAFRQLTSTIPIVFAISTDPLGAGLVTSLARPGGNVTGLSLLNAELGGKRLEILREIIPGMRRVAILRNADNAATATEVTQVQAAAQTLGLSVLTSGIRRSQEIAPAIDAIKGRADVLYIQTDPLMNTNRAQIALLAVGAQLPTLAGIREYAEAGILISYGANFPDQFRRAAEFADKILRGAKPADLPVEQAAKFDLVVNLTAAKALGLKIPESFLLRADQVIE